MIMWYVIMWVSLVLTGVALVYVSNRVCLFAGVKKQAKDNEKIKAMIGGGSVFGTFSLICIWLNFINAMVCIIYFALSWLICDFIFYTAAKIRKKAFQHYYAGGAAIALSLAALGTGWYLNHHVWKTNYTLSSSKLSQPLKVAMFADSHIGTTFDADGFAAHIDAIQAENPDVLLIAGDFVDDDTSPKDMSAACKKLGQMQTKYGVYFVFGNHDKGYYGAAHRGFSEADLIAELEKNGVKVLQDETVLLDNSVYIVGRKDFSFGFASGNQRLSMNDLISKSDKNKYSIIIDHQPRDYINQAKSGVDLVLSGHTHGGQLFPFNQIGKLIGANDAIYGYERRQNTDFIVTSGLSDWAIKFKTGTKSEFVIIDIKPSAQGL